MLKTYISRASVCLLLSVGGVGITYAQTATNYVAKVGETQYTTLTEAVEKATAGQTVTLLSEVSDASTSLSVTKDLTFDLNGQDVTLQSLYVKNGANVVLEDLTATVAPSVSDTYAVTYTAGTLTVTKNIIALQGSSITVNSGKYNSTSSSLLQAYGDFKGTSPISSTVTVNGGYLESQEFTVSVYGKGAIANINGGVMEARDNAVVAGNGTNNATYKYGGTTINITGGTMIGNIQSSGYVACGVYHPQEGTLNISGGKIVALGGCGVLMRGGTLNQTGGEVIATGDASTTGKVGDARVVVGTAGVIFDRDANYYDASNTTVTISGDSKVSGTKAAVEVINTSKKEDAEDAVTIKGGTFSGTAEDIAQFLDESDYTTETDGTVTVQGNYYQAKIGDNKYTSLSAAFSAATTGQTVVALCDVTDKDTGYEINGKNIAFDLNGKNLYLKYVEAQNGAVVNLLDNTAKTQPVVSDDYQTVTYTAGTLHVVYDLSAVTGASLIVNSGKYINDEGSFLRSWGDNTGASEVKSSVTVNGGYLESQEITVTAQGKGAIATIANGVMVARDNAVVGGNGSNADNNKQGGTTINITGGTMISHIVSGGYIACGVYHPQEGTLLISGGKIVALGGCGVLMRGGKLNLTGGEIIATGDASTTGKVGDTRVAVGTAGVVYDYDAAYYDANNVYVSISDNAKVSGAKTAVEVINSNKVPSAEASVKISGGTFSSDVTDYCVDGYVAVANGEGMYGLVTGDIIIGYKNNSKVVAATEKSLEFSTTDLTKLLVNANVDDATVKMTKNFSTTNWSSFYVPFDITITDELLEKFSFAKLWDTELVDDATTLEFKLLKAGDKIPANTPCLIKALTEGENTLELTGTSIAKTTNASLDCSTFDQKFTFTGVYESTTLLDKYGYYLNPAKQQFTAVSSATATLPPTTFYMTIQNKSDNSYCYPTENQSVAKTIRFYVSGDDTTGINEVNNATGEAAQKVYNLQGVYMGNDQTVLPAGLYIVNGKKVVVK